MKGPAPDEHENVAGIARTDATGRVEMIPELLAWSSSLPHDRTFVCEDILGSAAHVTMLRKVIVLAGCHRCSRTRRPPSRSVDRQ